MDVSTLGQIPRQVLDSRGHLHQLASDPLGCGGQGVVFRTRDPNTAVKLITDDDQHPVVDGGARQRLQEQLEYVQVLPVNDLHMAQPLATLDAPYVGYVMHLLTGMTPIRVLCSRVPTEPAKFYIESGGLRRRLRLLARTAGILARLHAGPLVYGDISDNNIFVSEDNDATEAWLIDVDNLRYVDQPGVTFYTAGFGAPEVVTGRSHANTLTDSYSFAILSHLCLRMHHPFLGQLVEEQCDWESDEDMEARAYAGEFPWIDDPDDKRNASVHGIPGSTVLTGELQSLFQATFGPGRGDPVARPGMSRWAEALTRAADWTLRCGRCGGTFYTAPQCSWCDAPRPAFVSVVVWRWDPQDDSDAFTIRARGLPQHSPNGRSSALRRGPVWRLVLDAASTWQVPRHVVRPTLLRDDDPPSLRLALLRNRVVAKPEDDGEYHLVLPDDKACQPLRGETSFVPGPSPSCWYIHCGPLDRPHRVLECHYFPEERA